MSYHLPLGAKGILGRDVLNGLWNTAECMTGANRYQEIKDDSCQFFRAQNVVMFESDLDIDADGTDSEVPGDTYEPDTALHDPAGRPLSSTNFPFMVIPQKIHDGRFNLQDLGLDLGDVGLAVYNGHTCAFLFGDLGPRVKIGEGSRFLARRLGINDSPTRGGVDSGVVTVCFPGSRDNIHGRTNLAVPQLLVRVSRLWADFVAAGKTISAGEVPQKNTIGGLS